MLLLQNIASFETSFLYGLCWTTDVTAHAAFQVVPAIVHFLIPKLYRAIYRAIWPDNVSAMDELDFF